MGGSLSAQYYELVWRAVREGPEVLEALWGEAPGFRDLFRMASQHPSDNVALRFYAAALYAASMLLSEIARAAAEAPFSCEWAEGPAREAVILARSLLRDVRQERSLYRAGRRLADLVEGIIKALGEAGGSVARCCEAGGAGECLG